MSQRYDNIAKYITTEYAEDYINFILGFQNVKVIENLTTEQITLKSRETDCTLKVQFPDEIAIIHNEVQAQDSQEPMSIRMAGYNGFLIREHQLKVYSSVLYLHPHTGKNDPGFFEYSGYECEYRLKYKVVRLIDIDGREILDAEVPGLLPLTPLMSPHSALAPNLWLEKCIDATFSAPVNTDDRNLLLAALGVFSGLVYDPQLIKQLLPETVMHESAYFREILQEAKEQGLERGLELGIEQGVHQGQKESTVDSILMLLNDKYNSDSIQDLKSTLEAIDDLETLKQLLRMIPKTISLEEFTSKLNNIDS